MNDVITIQEYNLLDYSLKLQEAIENGYRLGTGVDDCPMIIGFSYYATLSKAPVEVGGLGQAHELVVISGVVQEVFVVPQTETPVESLKQPTKRVKRG